MKKTKVQSNGVKKNSEKDLFELDPELERLYYKVRERLEKKNLLGNIKFPI